jgi:hypothetical protein
MINYYSGDDTLDNILYKIILDSINERDNNE